VTKSAKVSFEKQEILTMGMTPSLFSIEALAVETARDRRTIARALRNVTPDGKGKGRPAWRLATALEALDRRSGGGGIGTKADHDALLELANTIERGFERARGIADLEERRAFLKELGPRVGEMERGLAALNPSNDVIGTIVHDHILGGTINEFLGLMEMTLVLDQPEAVQN
jgi:hypothetical protein